LKTAENSGVIIQLKSVEVLFSYDSQCSKINNITEVTVARTPNYFNGEKKKGSNKGFVRNGLIS